MAFHFTACSSARWLLCSLFCGKYMLCRFNAVCYVSLLAMLTNHLAPCLCLVSIICMLQPRQMLEAAVLAVHSNLKDLRKEFPLATFKALTVHNGRMDVPTHLVTYCPASMHTVVLKRMQQAADAIQFSSASVSTAGIAPDKVQLVTDTSKVAAFRRLLEEDFGCYVKLDVDTASKAVTITTLKVVLPDADRRVRLWLGLPVQTASVLAQGPLEAEQKALAALLQVSPMLASAHSTAAFVRY